MGGEALFILAALGGLFWGLKTATGLRREVDEFAQRWGDEYDLRACAAVAAAGANLRSSAALVGTTRPSVASAATRLAADWSVGLASAYSAGLQANGSGDCWLGPPHRLKGSSFLHEEKHTGQPHGWPNWTAHYHLEWKQESDLDSAEAHDSAKPDAAE